MTESVKQAEHATELANAAVQLRKAAVRADRPDIVAKADEVIAALRENKDRERGGKDVTNAILRTLDGLGF